MESIKAAVSLAETGVTQAVAQIGRLGNRSAVAQAAVCAPPPARPCTNAHIWHRAGDGWRHKQGRWLWSAWWFWQSCVTVQIASCQLTSEHQVHKTKTTKAEGSCTASQETAFHCGNPTPTTSTFISRKNSCLSVSFCCEYIKTELYQEAVWFSSKSRGRSGIRCGTEQFNLFLGGRCQTWCDPELRGDVQCTAVPSGMLK